MGEWVQLGDGECDEPWYRELDEGEVQLCADGCQVSDAIGFQYAELDRLPRYKEIIAERDAAQKRIAFFEKASELWKEEENIRDECEAGLIAEHDDLLEEAARLRERVQKLEEVADAAAYWLEMEFIEPPASFDGRMEARSMMADALRRFKAPPDDHV